MDLKSGYPYFLIKDGLYQNFETLKSNHICDILVLGGGISGALMAYQLIKNGINCTIVDRRIIGLGSTSASTSLLQYEIDVPLHQLEKLIGKDNAAVAYKLCGESINKLKDIADEIGYSDYKFCESLYFSHSKNKHQYLIDEFNSRKNAGFDVELLNEDEIFSKFGLHAHSAILSQHAAKIDAYLFMHFLHKYNIKNGVNVFENTNIIKINESKFGVELVCEKGYIIKTKKIIYATGYETVEQISKPLLKLTSTYAAVSERNHLLPKFFEHTLLWNTDNPYLYIREDEGKIIIGGRDEDFYNPEKRDRLLESKTKKLENDFKKLFPDIEFKTLFSWTGTFGSTKDGLPYIGTYGKNPNSYFALGFGGNGITFSALAADMITKQIRGEINSVPKMFSFNR